MLIGLFFIGIGIRAIYLANKKDNKWGNKAWMVSLSGILAIIAGLLKLLLSFT